MLTLENLGIPVESSHHEAAPSQHEIDLRHTDALTMADTVMTYKLVVKEIAMSHGYFASFMPKPSSAINGNGMHTHMSLFRGDENVFYSPNGKHTLSETARQFCAGLLKHAREITLVTNQWVNSFKRLVPSYEAPIYVTWAEANRSDLLRIPSFKPGRESSRRIEYRAPDPACNPYLAFSVMLAAGMEGIENKYDKDMEEWNYTGPKETSKIFEKHTKNKKNPRKKLAHKRKRFMDSLAGVWFWEKSSGSFFLCRPCEN